MKNPRLWAWLTYTLGGICGIALVLPQFRIYIWDSGQIGYLYLWGGAQKVNATVSGSIYLIAAIWGLAAVGALLWAGNKLRHKERQAIAWMNWAAFFIAMELSFLLVAAEEVLTDLRVEALHADSFASLGSWMSFVVLFSLLFLPGRAKRLLFPR
ncbi:MAG: hypothetical protein NZZ60_00840 [Bacteroidia bacterium]|nr:hypothetical protein [Bacteroidia bacterium]MCX7652094.1 hypothetical protein [Bacteroidia bacterium]MDW8417121.1 hypothetical protein [Bacteroidia bacterium]